MHIDPNYPSSVEAAAECAKKGEHEPFNTPPDPEDRRVNTELLGAFMGAAMEVPIGCRPCQARLLDDLADSPDTVARLVEVAAMMYTEAFGGVPSTIMDAEAGAVAPEFARLAAAGADGHNADMYALAHQMSRQERRVGASAAADAIVGMLAVLG